MLFIEWWFFSWFCVGLLMLMVAVGTLGLWVVRRKERPIRLSMQFIGLFCGLVGALFILLAWWGASSHVYSVPVYSPDRKMAARIDDYVAGGIGGSYDSVELFTAYGFRSDLVFVGDWKSIRSASLRWKGDSQLEISYQGRSGFCGSTARVKVHCIVQ
jgi:hypothetical protein